jgi:hypothetical protein
MKSESDASKGELREVGTHEVVKAVLIVMAVVLSLIPLSFRRRKAEKG